MMMKRKQEEKIKDAYILYLDLARQYLVKALTTKNILDKHPRFLECYFSEISAFIGHAYRQIDQIERRVLKGEKIPHDEKVFSLFQPHTEWIKKGKAGIAMELGLNVCIIEDQYGFILHHNVMQSISDSGMIVNFIEETKNIFPDLALCSLDKGFYSKQNKEDLEKILEICVIPKKGKLSKQEYEIENSEEFKKFRRQHSAVESAINALEVHGLDKCYDHGIDGFNRYVSLAVVARNIQKLGSIIQQNKIKQRKAA